MYLGSSRKNLKSKDMPSGPSSTHDLPDIAPWKRLQCGSMSWRQDLLRRREQEGCRWRDVRAEDGTHDRGRDDADGRAHAEGYSHEAGPADGRYSD